METYSSIPVRIRTFRPEAKPLFHHCRHSFLKLFIVSVEIVFRGVIDFHIGIELMVLTLLPIHIPTAYLWNTEDEATVHQRLPPDSRHRTCHRRADEFTNA